MTAQQNYNKFAGKASTIPFLGNFVTPEFPQSPGGRVTVEVAAGTLLYGDIVFRNFGGRMEKSLESSPYFAFDWGVVVGGKVGNYEYPTTDSGLIGQTMATVGQNVIIQRSGVCYVSVDSTAIIQVGHSIYPGQSTAGRVLGGVSAGSYASNPAALAIHGAASALAKSVNVMATQIAGAPGTNTAANLDTAALSGTTANGQYGMYVFRVATNGTSVTSAKAADAASMSAIIWPTAGAANLATYGAVIVHPTGTGGFVGGTTALDDATVVPNAVYYDIFGRRNRLGVSLDVSDGTAGHALLIELG